MRLFGIGAKKENTKGKSDKIQAKGPQTSARQLGDGDKSGAVQKPVLSSDTTEMSVKRNVYAPVAKVPSDSAFMNVMGDINQPAAVYQQNLARQWQHKAAVRAEIQNDAVYEEQIMRGGQSISLAGVNSKQQWPIMPLEFHIEHFDIQNPRYHTMFRHLGISKTFFTATVKVYMALLDEYQEQKKKNVKQFRSSDWQAVGDRVADCVNKALSIQFNQLVRMDYSYSDLQKTGKYILTYPLSPEDIIPWCEAQKIPYLTDMGKAEWLKHKATLQSA